MGRQPVVVIRNNAGQVNAFLNACSHKGATLCRTQTGSKPNGFACQYHDWCFDLDGQLQYVPRREEGYPASFKLERQPDRRGAGGELWRLHLRQPECRRATAARAPG